MRICRGVSIVLYTRRHRTARNHALTMSSACKAPGPRRRREAVRPRVAPQCDGQWRCKSQGCQYALLRGYQRMGSFDSSNLDINTACLSTGSATKNRLHLFSGPGRVIVRIIIGRGCDSLLGMSGRSTSEPRRSRTPDSNWTIISAPIRMQHSQGALHERDDGGQRELYSPTMRLRSASRSSPRPCLHSQRT